MINRIQTAKMFADIKTCDTVLVTVEGKKSNASSKPEKFLVPATVTSHTRTRFVARGTTYKKSDGYSYPAGNGRCLPYKESDDETKQLATHNANVAIIKETNDLLWSLCKLRVSADTKNINAILAAAETLSDLLDRGSAS